MRGMARRLTMAMALALALLAFSLMAFGTPAMASDKPSVFVRGTWAVTDYEGPHHSNPEASMAHWSFDYNKYGQITKSSTTKNSFGNITGESGRYTWSEDGLSYQGSVTTYSGWNGENRRDYETSGTYEVEYESLSATFELPARHVRYTLEYRKDGILERKVVEGAISAKSIETYEYDERGDLVRYTLEGNDADLRNEAATYDVHYEGDMPASVVVTRTFSADSDVGELPDDENYELTLQTDRDGNVISAQRDGETVASFEWYYVRHPDPLARLIIHSQMSSVYEVL